MSGRPGEDELMQARPSNSEGASAFSRACREEEAEETRELAGSIDGGRLSAAGGSDIVISVTERFL